MVSTAGRVGPAWPQDADSSESNCSVSPWTNGRSASSLQRKPYCVGVAADPPARRLDQPRTGQPRVLAVPRNPFALLANRPHRSDTTGLGLRFARCPDGGGVGALVGCSGAIKANPSGVRDHGFTEQLHPRAFEGVDLHPVQETRTDKGTTIDPDKVKKVFATLYNIDAHPAIQSPLTWVQVCLSPSTLPSRRPVSRKGGQPVRDIVLLNSVLPMCTAWRYTVR